MTDQELIDAGWKYHQVAGTPGHNWTRDGDRLSYTKPQAEALVAIKNSPPAPRPTCGTCPLWDASAKEDERGLGSCCSGPPALCEFAKHNANDRLGLYPLTHRRWWCGQHPGMAAWIRDEWPKVRAGK